MPTLAKFSALFIACIALAAPFPIFAYNFPANLRLGDSGIDIMALQQSLNASPDTLVASVGPGSPGQETAYFGLKTLDAVKRFQNKYFADVLAPGGLTAPTGFVGPATRAKLQNLPSSATPAAASVPAQGVSSAAPANTSGSGQAILPDMATRIEQYIADTKKGLKEEGQSDRTIALVEEKIRDIAPKADKALDSFYKQEQEFYKNKQAEAGGPVMAFFKNSLSTVSSFFIPETAHAALGLPFGGYVSTVMPVCTCSPTVSQILIFLPGANVVTSNLTLDYVFGTQAFNWHNLPLPGVATLGVYEPITPTCFMHVGSACVPLPSRGLITPMTGSSLTPL